MSTLLEYGVAAMTGLTFLAYYHPNGFQRIALGIFVIITLLMVGAIIWDFRNATTLGHLQPLLAIGKSADAERIVAQDALPLPAFEYLAVVVYLAFLWFLPRIIR